MDNVFLSSTPRLFTPFNITLILKDNSHCRSNSALNSASNSASNSHLCKLSFGFKNTKNQRKLRGDVKSPVGRSVNQTSNPNMKADTTVLVFYALSLSSLCGFAFHDRLYVYFRWLVIQVLRNFIYIGVLLSGFSLVYR